MPNMGEAEPNREGVVILMSPGLKYTLLIRSETKARRNQGLLQNVKFRIKANLEASGLHVSPQTSGHMLEEKLEKLRNYTDMNVIPVVYFNARHVTWDRVSNRRGESLMKFAIKRNYAISPPNNLSYFAKGQKVCSKRNLLLLRKKMGLEQLREEGWEGTSDGLPYPGGPHSGQGANRRPERERRINH